MLGDMRRDRYDSVFHSHDRTGGKEDRPHHRNLSIFRIHERLVSGHVYDGQRPGGMGMARISRKRMGMNYPYTVYYVDMRGIRQICLNVEKYIQEQETCEYVKPAPPHEAAKLIQMLLSHKFFVHVSSACGM